MNKILFFLTFVVTFLSSNEGYLYNSLFSSLNKQNIPENYYKQFFYTYGKEKINTFTIKMYTPKKKKYKQSMEKKATNNLKKYIHLLQKHLDKYKIVYDEAEKKFGINREIIASILLKETFLGHVSLKFDTLTSLNSIYRSHYNKNSHKSKNLFTMAKNNLVSLITFCYQNNIKIEQCKMKSSYAGATGIPQFMPQNFKFIIGYKNSKGDLNKMEDAILSTANFLKQNTKLSFLNWNDFQNTPSIEKEWYQYNFNTKRASFAKNKIYNKSLNCFSCNRKDLQIYNHVIKQIMKYNNSSNYAIGVLSIAYLASKKTS